MDKCQNGRFKRRVLVRNPNKWWQKEDVEVRKTLQTCMQIQHVPDSSCLCSVQSVPGVNTVALMMNTHFALSPSIIL